MTDRYEFLKTIEHEGKIKALIIDKEARGADGQVLGDSGALSTRNAFNAHANPRIRSGVLPFAMQEILDKVRELENSGGKMPKSIAAFERAAVCIEAKTSGGKPPSIEQTHDKYLAIVGALHTRPATAHHAKMAAG